MKTKREYILKSDLIELLFNEGEIKNKDFKIMPNIKINSSTYHCKICGRYFDDCVCEHNFWVESLNKLTKEI
jgi:hypothetical protein